MQLSCKKCGYTWEYAGNKHRTSCSKCRTSITILGHDLKADRVLTIPPVQILTNKYVTEVKFPHSLWKDARLAQRMQHLPSLGEQYLVLKVNSEGFLSL